MSVFYFIDFRRDLLFLLTWGFLFFQIETEILDLFQAQVFPCCQSPTHDCQHVQAPLRPAVLGSRSADRSRIGLLTVVHVCKQHLLCSPAGSVVSASDILASSERLRAVAIVVATRA